MMKIMVKKYVIGQFSPLDTLALLHELTISYQIVRNCGLPPCPYNSYRPFQ